MKFLSDQVNSTCQQPNYSKRGRIRINTKISVVDADNCLQTAMNEWCKTNCMAETVLARRFWQSGWRWGCFETEENNTGESCVTASGETIFCFRGGGKSCKDLNGSNKIEGIITNKQDHCPGKIISFDSSHSKLKLKGRNS